MRPVRRLNRPTRDGAITLSAVALIAAAVITFKVMASTSTGPGWDTYAFLANAAEFAGKGYGYTELHRPPALSLLTAAAFALGAPLEEWVIQWMDGLLSFAGIIAFYLIARRRFRPLLSGVGALMFLGVAPLWAYLGSGYTDFPSVALSMWLLWSCMKATEDSPWWYLLAGPLFVAATMTRYTALLALFPALIWVALRWRPFHQAKQIAGGVVLAIASYLPAARFYAERFGDVLFPFILAFGVSENISAPDGEGAVRSSAMWYLTELPGHLAGEKLVLMGVLILLVAFLGTLLGTVSFLRTHKPRPSRLLMAVLLTIPAVLAQIAGGLVTRQVTIAIAVYAIWHALAPYEEDERGRRVTASSAPLAAMLAWLLIYFDAYGHQTVQVARYLVAMLPGLVFVILYGWQMFMVDIRRTLTREEDVPEDAGMRAWLRFGAPVGLGVLVAIAIAAAMLGTSSEANRTVQAARETALWLSHQDGIAEAAVFSDVWPLTAWYARIPARPMPFYNDDEARQHALDKVPVDYYVTLRSRTFDGFEAVQTGGGATVLRRVESAPEELPHVLYLGKAWDNYLETVTGYTFYLDGDSGRYGWEGTAFLDSMTAEELAAYDAVAVYGVRWRERADGEAALLDYVRNGGAVIIDASENLGELPYDLANTVMFDTVIRRQEMAENASIEVGDALVELEPRLSGMDASPFLDEDGSPWYGADYTTLPGTSEISVLATVGGRPAVAMRQIGKGRVYWIGYNLVWHAFLTENTDEQALIAAVFEDALGDPDAP
ncbi:MAG: glycosyltransferase family 39 protein [Coriobacteriia bacterium]|nr:glycosyltransferase family 39 protein [Coriobacteriia bacterium]